MPNLAESVDSQFISCEYKKALETEEKEKEAQDEKEDTEKEGEELFIQLDVATNWIPNSGLIAPEHQFTLIGTDSEVLTPPPQYV